MRKSLSLAAILAALILGTIVSSNTVTAQEEAKAKVALMIIQPPAGRYSPSLRAWFVVSQNFTLPWYQYQFPGARITRMQPNSPLQRIGLQPGDVITRLDNMRVACYGELDNHFDWSTVRYIKRGTTSVYNGSVYIGNSNYTTGFGGGQRP